MTQFVFANRASTTIAHAVAVDATTVQLASGGGALFPALGPGQVFQAALINSSGVHEIVQATAIVGEVVTVLRGQEGTAAGTFDVGSRFELRYSAAVMGAMFQAAAGGQVHGDLDMLNNNIHNVNFPEPIVAAATHTNFVRGADVPLDDDGFEGGIFFPAGKGPPTVGWADGFSTLLSARHFAHIVFPWSGDLADLEPWWKLCDGTFGTPDLRRRFILGANVPENADGPITPHNEVGGSFAGVTDIRGAHNHGGKVANTQLGTGNIPPVHVNSRTVGVSLAGSQILVLTDASTFYQDGAGYVHSHGVFSDGGHQHLYTIVPQFWALTYVMFNLP